MKAALRKELLEKRDALGDERRKQASAKIAERLKALPGYEVARTVLFYVDFRSEVMTRAMIEDAIKSGKRVLAPKVVPGSYCLRLFRIQDPDAELAPGHMGIYEPAADPEKEVKPGEIDFIALPGVGFDKRGGRLGYGAGCYDRLLRLVRPDTALAGLAFDVQVVDELPVESHDMAVQWVVTETRVISP